MLPADLVRRSCFKKGAPLSIEERKEVMEDEVSCLGGGSEEREDEGGGGGVKNIEKGEALVDFAFNCSLSMRAQLSRLWMNEKYLGSTISDLVSVTKQILLLFRTLA
jgi:hypothetical protein